ncbi:MAG TPA: aconitase/3-isopropylmalate dehydratase large subunit family protein [Bryobacteraceae bacterium]|jgi:3-isopropylmalate/(R)-2-methylmalate dehydratase large subunit|nr:aconitase/3-isopropylmalate dehydratase large subunit family protein [Bryobacteraceae bacterium]
MPGKTITEKILSAKSGQDVRAGDVAVCPVDCALGTDGSTPMALDYFESMGGRRVFDPKRIVFALDHYAPAPNRAIAQLHQRMRDFAALHSIELWDVGEGIGHQLIVESGRAAPGGLVVGADSHAVTYGALNCFGTGIGSSDLAAILMCGEIWLRVPESIRVTLTGELPRGVYAKDVALALARELGADGATYQALEFGGPALPTLPLDDRLVLSNLTVEMGAKNGIFSNTGLPACPSAVEPDPDARYTREVVIALDVLTPQVALPHQVDRVADIGEAAGTPVQMVYLGTCTGGRVRDFHQARDVLRAGGGVARGVQLVVTPASRAVLETLTRDGTLADFIAMGAVVITPGCGSCCGTCGAIPGDGVVLSTANRNFKGRMGNSNAAIYLASPASCAAAAVRGAIADPREFDT